MSVCPHGVAVSPRKDGDVRGCHRCALEQLTACRAAHSAKEEQLSAWIRAFGHLQAAVHPHLVVDVKDPEAMAAACVEHLRRLMPRTMEPEPCACGEVMLDPFIGTRVKVYGVGRSTDHRREKCTPRQEEASLVSPPGHAVLDCSRLTPREAEVYEQGYKDGESSAANDRAMEEERKPECQHEWVPQGAYLRCSKCGDHVYAADAAPPAPAGKDEP